MEDNCQRIAGLLLLLGPALFFGLAVKDCRAQPVRAQVSVPSFSKADFIGSIATICRRSLQTAAALHVTAGAITGHVEDSHPEGRARHRRPEGANLECRAYLLAPIGLPARPC